MGWNRWVKWVAPFSMAQSFMAVATLSAMAGSSGGPLLDGLLQGLEDRLGQALPLHFLVEDVDAEEVLEVRLLEVDAVELMACGSDGLDGQLADVRAHMCRYPWSQAESTPARCSDGARDKGVERADPAAIRLTPRIC